MPRGRRLSGSMLDGVDYSDESIEALQRARGDEPDPEPERMSNEQALMSGRPLMGNQYGGVVAALPAVVKSEVENRLQCRGCNNTFFGEQSLINHLETYKKEFCGKDVFGHFVFSENRKRCLKCNQNLKDLKITIRRDELVELINHVSGCRGTKNRPYEPNTFRSSEGPSRSDEHSERRSTPAASNQTNRRKSAPAGMECVICFDFQRDKQALQQHLYKTRCGLVVNQYFDDNGTCNSCKKPNALEFLEKYRHYKECSSQEASNVSSSQTSTYSATPAPNVPPPVVSSAPTVTNDRVNGVPSSVSPRPERVTPSPHVSPPAPSMRVPPPPPPRVSSPATSMRVPPPRMSPPAPSARVVPPPPPLDTQEDSSMPNLKQETQSAQNGYSNYRTNTDYHESSNHRRNYSSESQSRHNPREDYRSSSLPRDRRDYSSSSRTDPSTHNSFHASRTNQNNRYSDSRSNDRDWRQPPRRNSATEMPPPPTPHRSHQSSSFNSSHHREQSFHSSSRSREEYRQEPSRPERTNSADRTPVAPPPPRISPPLPPVEVVDLDDDEDSDNESVVTSVATTNQAAPSVLSMYYREADNLCRAIVVDGQVPEIHRVEFVCKKCPYHGESSTAFKGRTHLRKLHSTFLCPCCFQTLPTHGSAYKDHLRQKHFVDKKSRREEIKCLFCSIQMSHLDMWEHIDDVHFARPDQDNDDWTRQRSQDTIGHRNNQSSESSPSPRVSESSATVGSGGSQMPNIASPPPPLILPSEPLPMPQAQPSRTDTTPSRQSEGRSSSHQDILPTTPGPLPPPPIAATDLLNELLNMPRASTSSAEQSSAEHGIESMGDEDLEITGARRYKSPYQLNELANAFIPNPNAPWKERADRLAKKLRLTPQTITAWFVSTRSSFMKDKYPSWAKRGYHHYTTPDGNLHIVGPNRRTQDNSEESISKSDDEELEEGEVSDAAENEVPVTTNSVSTEVVNLGSEESGEERSRSPSRRKSPERRQKESSGSKRSKETSKEKSSSATKKSKKRVISSEEDSEEDEPRKKKSNKTKRPSKNKGRKRKQVISSSSSEEGEEEVFEGPPNVPIENPADNSLRDALNNLSDDESCITVAIGPGRSSSRYLTTNSTPNTPRPTQPPDPPVADRNRRRSEPTELSAWGTSRVLRSESSKGSNKNTTDESHSNDTHSERDSRKRSSRNDGSSTNDSRHGSSEDSRSSRNKSRKSDDSGNKSREKDDSRSRSSSHKHSKKRSHEKSSSSSKSVREWDKSQQSSSKSSKHKNRDKNSEPPEKRKRSSEESGENIQSHRVKSHSASKVVIQIIRSGEKEKTNSPPAPSVANAENIAEHSVEDERLVGRCTLLKENFQTMQAEATAGKATNAMLDEIDKAISELETFVPVKPIVVTVTQKLFELHKKLKLQIQQFLAEQQTDESPPVLTPAMPLQVESSRRGESSTNSSSSISPPAPARNRSTSAAKRPNITQSSSNSNAQVPSRSDGSGSSGRKDPRLSPRAVAEQINRQMDSMKEQSPTAQSHQQNKNLQRATSSAPKSQQQPENRQGNSNRGPNPSQNRPHSQNNPPPSQNPLSAPNLSANQAPASKSSRNSALASKSSHNPTSAAKVSANPASASKSSENPTPASKSSQNPASASKSSENPTPASKFSQNPASASNLSQYRPSAPKVSQNPASAPKPSQNPASVPKSVQNPASVPKSVQNPVSVPKSVQNSASIPKSVQNPASIPKSVQNSAAVPRSVQNPGSIQKSVQNSSSVPRSVQNPASVPNFSQSRTSNQIRPSSNPAPAPNTSPAQMPPPSAIPPRYRHYAPASATTATRPSVPSAQNGQQFRPSSSRHRYPFPNGQFRSPVPHQRGPLPLTPFHQPQNQLPTNGRMPKYQNFSLNNNASPPNSFSQRSPPPTNPGFRGAPGRQQHSSNHVRPNGPTPVPTAGNRNVIDYNHQITNLNRSPRGERAGVRSPEENGYFSASPTDEAPATNDYKSRNEAMQKISRSEIGSLYLKAKKGYCRTIQGYFDSGMPIQQVNVKKQTELLAPYTETQNQKAFTAANKGYLEDQMENTPEFASNDYKNNKNFKKDVLRHWLPVFLYALKFTIRIDQAVHDFVQTAARKVNTKLTPEEHVVKEMFPTMP